MLKIENLSIDFVSGSSIVRAVNGLDLQVHEGQTVFLVGESGCGKSATALSIARLLPEPPARYSSGRVLLKGQDVLQMTRAELRRIRGGVVSYVFQEPASSLNPVMRVGSQIREALELHQPKQANEVEVVRLLRLVRIGAPEIRARDYPFQMSGGMQQRVMLAMALASRPDLLIADEPTTALDATIQAQILDLLRELKEQSGISVLLITHNLGIVGGMADALAVMYAGQLVEFGPANETLRDPLHPYTQALLASVPRMGHRSERLAVIPGQVPRLDQRMPSACRFAARCPYARSDCLEKEPEWREVKTGRWVRCPHVEEIQTSSREEGPNRNRPKQSGICGPAGGHSNQG